MAQGIPFFGANIMLKSPPGMGDSCVDLPAFKGEPPEFISCWKLTPEELAIVAKTGEVWVSVAAAQSPQPISVTGLPRIMAYGRDGRPVPYRTDGRHVILEAMDYAMEKHGDQPYGPYTHAYHLGCVVDILDRYGYGMEEQSAGWLHDVEEDTDLDLDIEERRAAIRAYFGDVIENLVWAVTGVKVIDGVKQNRKACNDQMYAKIAEYPRSGPIKGADRLANMYACLQFNDEDKGGMYVKELPSFLEHVGPYISYEMTTELISVFNQLIERFPRLAKYKDTL